jgi:methyl-accepting chemotaxis protein
MGRFRNLGLTLKTLVAPAIMLAALVAMAALAVTNASRQEDATQHLDAAIFEPLSRAVESKDAATLFHARLFAFMSAAANENDAKKKEADAAALGPELERVSNLIDRLITEMAANPDATTHLEGINKTFAAYSDGARQTIDMAKMDAAYGVMLMGETHAQFVKLRAQLDEMSAAMQERRRVSVAQILSDMAKARVTFLVVLGLAATISLLAAVLVGRAIAQPIVRLTAAMGKLASGEWATEVPEGDRGDEIGRMANAVIVFKQSGITAQELEAQQREEQTEKERRQKAVEDHIAAFEHDATTAIRALSGAASGLHSTSEALSTIAEETGRQATTVAAASEQASANVQTVASAAEELSTSISEIGAQVTGSAKTSAQAVQEAEKTSTLIQGLADAAQKIGDVVRLINEIASQTNLLALNATIEAARAGEAGKGFAVVASEVKALANQTAKATEEIGSQVSAIQGATREAVQAIQGITQTISKINDSASAIAAAVEEQGAATNEIARNVQQASSGTNEVSSNIASVRQAASQTGESSGNVLSAAQALTKDADTLRTRIDDFLSKVRAA